jgi:hypothetical protein
MFAGGGYVWFALGAFNSTVTLRDTPLISSEILHYYVIGLVAIAPSLIPI